MSQRGSEADSLLDQLELKVLADLFFFLVRFFWLVFEFFFPFCCGGSEAVSDGTMSQIQPREVRSLSKNRLHLVGTGNQDRKFIAQSPRPEL